MNNVGRFAAGFLVGVALTVVGAGLAASGEQAPAAAPTTSPPVANPVVVVEPWIAPEEVLIGSTVLLPQGVEVDEGIAYLDYDLVGLAPTLFADHEQPGVDTPVGDALAMPELWELTTTTGVTIPAETGPNQSSVKFELPDEDTEIATIEIVGWRVPVAFGDVVELPVEKGASAELRRGTLTVDAALVQSISTILKVDFERAGDPWQGDVRLRPEDPHWQITGGGGAGMQYTWSGDDAPDRIVLHDVGYDMRPFRGEILVYTAPVQS